MIVLPSRTRLRPSLGTSMQGVVLLEVLVAILIFSFGILGTVGLLARATQFSVNAEDRNRAALLANDLVSEMWTHRSLAPDVPAWRARANAALPNGDLAFVPNVAASAATITITWRAPSARTGDPDNRYVTAVAIP